VSDIKTGHVSAAKNSGSYETFCCGLGGSGAEGGGRKETAQSALLHIQKAEALCF
jgi:hypothetical protein